MMSIMRFLSLVTENMMNILFDALPEDLLREEAFLLSIIVAWLFQEILRQVEYSMHVYRKSSDNIKESTFLYIFL